jgi:hypothetical protein
MRQYLSLIVSAIRAFEPQSKLRNLLRHPPLILVLSSGTSLAREMWFLYRFPESRALDEAVLMLGTVSPLLGLLAVQFSAEWATGRISQRAAGFVESALLTAAVFGFVTGNTLFVAIMVGLCLAQTSFEMHRVTLAGKQTFGLWVTVISPIFSVVYSLQFASQTTVSLLRAYLIGNLLQAFALLLVAGFRSDSPTASERKNRLISFAILALPSLVMAASKRGFNGLEPGKAARAAFALSVASSAAVALSSLRSIQATLGCHTDSPVRVLRHFAWVAFVPITIAVVCLLLASLYVEDGSTASGMVPYLLASTVVIVPMAAASVVSRDSRVQNQVGLEALLSAIVLLLVFGLVGMSLQRATKGLSIFIAILLGELTWIAVVSLLDHNRRRGATAVYQSGCDFRK